MALDVDSEFTMVNSPIHTEDTGITDSSASSLLKKKKKKESLSEKALTCSHMTKRHDVAAPTGS